MDDRRAGGDEGCSEGEGREGQFPVGDARTHAREAGGLPADPDVTRRHEEAWARARVLLAALDGRDGRRVAAAMTEEEAGRILRDGMVAAAILGRRLT